MTALPMSRPRAAVIELRDTCVMLATCSTGALAGLALDLRHGDRAHLCMTAAGPWAALLRHCTTITWMTIFMLAGGALAMVLIAAAPARKRAGWLRNAAGRCGFNFACHLAMLASMAVVPLLPSVPVTAADAAARMLAAMGVSAALVVLAYRFVPAVPWER